MQISHGQMVGESHWTNDILNQLRNQCVNIQNRED